MIEVDVRLQPVRVDRLDRDGLLELARESEVQERVAARRKLRYALHWCHLNPVPEGGCPAGMGEGLSSRAGGDCEDHIAGPGTPLVAAGSPAELGAAWGVTTQSAVSWMGHALELSYRLPLTWARLEALQIQPWKARRLATWTTPLPPEGAAWVDAQLAPRLDQIGYPTIEKTITAAIAIWRPDLVKEREAHGKDAWHVTLDAAIGPGGLWDGTSTLDARGDTGDFTDFVALVARVAAALEADGDTDTLDQRRAKALGVIGRGEHHELLRRVGVGAVGEVDDAEPTDAEPRDEPSGEPHRDPRAGAGNASRSSQPQPAAPGEGEPKPAKPARSPRLPAIRRGTQPNTLYVHLTTADLTRHLTHTHDTPLGRVERLGPATLDLIRTWVGRGKFRIQPVLNHHTTAAVDYHDPPAWMREAVILRDQHCVFPWCATDARACDLDHIDPYLPHGPPGQTHTHNLACLCRRHHNAKTHHGWRYHRLPDGNYLWTSPAGHHYLVHPGDEGTVRLPRD